MLLILPDLAAVVVLLEMSPTVPVKLHPKRPVASSGFTCLMVILLFYASELPKLIHICTSS